jgi:hypothetical protein
VNSVSALGAAFVASNMTRRWLAKDKYLMRMSSIWLKSKTNKQKGRRRNTSAGLQLRPLEERNLFAVAIVNNGGNGYAGLNISQGGGFTPPDTQGAAGPTEYIETVNSAVAIYNPKATGASAVTDGLNHFFATTGGLSVQGLSDATGIYVDTIGRFIVADMDLGSSNFSALDIAVSKSSSPATLGTADWKFYQIVTTESGFGADYPGNMGFNADAFVFTFNMASSTASHVRVVSINANDLKNGVASPATFFNNLADFDVRPTAMHDSKTGDPMWLVTEHGDGLSIDVYKMTGVLSNSANFSSKTNLAVMPYSTVVPPLNPDGSVITTNVIQSILKSAEANNKIVACHHVSVSSTQDVDDWYEFDVSSGTPTLAAQGRISAGANTYLTYPSIDINPSGQIGLTFIRQGTDTPTDYPSMWVMAGTTAALGSPIKVPAGAGATNLNGGGREGDFSGINVDPVDGSFWAANEYSPPGGSWGTAIANFIATGVVTNANDSGPGSLRQVIADNASIPGAVVTFDPTFFATPHTITLTSGEIMISSVMTISGPGAGLVTVSGNSANRIFETNLSSGTVTISGLTLTGGKDSTGLGGGAIHAGANNSLQITNCAISGNSSNAGGGIFLGSGGSLNLSGSTFSGDGATNGGGVYFAGTIAAGGLAIRNCTFQGNNVPVAGGAIAVANLTGTLAVSNCTITGNAASTGGAIALTGATGSIAIDSTILFGDTAANGPEISTAGTATVNTSLVQSTSGVTTFTGDTFTNAHIGVDPLLGPLQNNGGSTLTRLPASASPAIDNGSNPAGLTTDQRGIGFPRVLNGQADIGAVETTPTALIVHNTNDSGVGSLRQAILDANGIAGANTITFDPAVFTSAKIITLTTGELLVSDSLVVNGPAAGLTISGNNASRVWDFSGGTTCTLTNMTMTKGNSSSKGGAISEGAGSLTLQGCTVTGSTSSSAGGGVYVGGTFSASYCTFGGAGTLRNSATSSATGGGLYINSGSSVTISACTIFNNSSASNGGGIQLFGAGTVTLNNCTISGNTASGTGTTGVGGGVRAGSGFTGTFNVNNTTIAFNTITAASTTGCGLSRNGGTFNVFSSIIAKNTGGSGGDLSGNMNINFSLIGNTANEGTITGANNINNTDPLLVALANNGGPTLTHALNAGSPAINKGSAGSLTTDQRGVGFVRVSGAAADMGAYEVQQLNLVVTNNNDSGTGSLRQAILNTNGNPGADSITFDPTFFNTAKTITLISGELDITDSVTITGPAAGVSVNGNNASRVFNSLVPGTGNVVMSNLTITNGNATSGGGAGILANDDNLTLTNCTVSNNNSASANFGAGVSTGSAAGTWTFTNCTLSGNTGANGGAAYFFSTGTLNMTGCTVSGNSANVIGGGALFMASITATITNSTIAGNQAAGGAGGTGGAILMSGAGSVTLNNCTVTGNNATTSGGGINVAAGTLALTSTIVAGNTVGGAAGAQADVNSAAATSVAGNNNLVGIMDPTNNVTLTGANNLAGTAGSPLNAGLGALSNYGGLTQTVALLPGSPAINAGTSVQAADQRGKSYVGAPDIGSFESQGFTIAIVSGSSQSAQINTAFAAPLVVSVTSTFGEPVNGGAVTFTPPASGASATPSSQTVIITGGNATSGTLTANGTAGGYNVAASANGANSVNFALTNTAPVTPSKITSIVVGDGTAQRSMVTQIGIDFNLAVSFVGSPAAAFTLVRESDSMAVTLAAAVDATNTMVTLTFIGGAVDFNSLADGRYTLTALANQFAGGGLDGNGDGIGGDNFVEVGAPGTGHNLFRFFGDVTGDGTVSAADFVLFRQSFGGVNPAFDFNGDGSVAASDFIQFRLRFGGSI